MKIYNILFAFLIIGALIGSAIAAPNPYNKELSSDVNLRGALFTDIDASSFYAWVDEDGRIHISSSTHYEDKTIKIKYNALSNRLKNFNDNSIGVTHIADDGSTTHFTQNIGEPDSQGFVYITCDFSEIILNGFTGNTLYSSNNINNNYTLSFNELNISELNVTISNLISSGNVLPLGSSKYISLGTYQNEFGFVDEFAFECDVYMPSATDDLQIIDLGYQSGAVDASNNGLRLYIESGQIIYRIEQGDGSAGWGGENRGLLGTGVTLNQGWNHIKVTRNSTAANTYLDGVLEDTQLFAGTTLNHWGSDGGSTDRKYQIGRATANLGDDSYIYSSTGTIVRNLKVYNDTDATLGDRVAQWDINEGTGTTVFDDVGSMDGTISGATWDVDPDGTSVGSLNVSVIGDSYVFTDNGSTTLTPSANISSVNFVTSNSVTQYDYNVTLYWTQANASFTETVANGYANFTILYTPIENITSGVFNATYSGITFSNHSYVGDIIATINDSTADVSRNEQTAIVNVTNLGIEEHTIHISVPYNPPIFAYEPINGTILEFPFPPLNHPVTLKWQETTGTYKYTITTQGGVFVEQGAASTNSTNVSLPADDYYWYVQGYDDVFEEYSLAPEVFDFTVKNNISILNNTAIAGIVFSQDGQTKTPIQNAVVKITNDTFSDSVVVGPDGFYSFLDLAPNETYFVSASAELYDDTGLLPVTTINNTVVEKEILMTLTTTDYIPHYVKFIVKDIFDNRYQNVDVLVYKGALDSGTVFRSGTTGVDGSVTFRLDQNVQYTLTFENASEGISESITIYPKNDFYNIYVIKTIVPDDEYSSDIVDVEITKSLINNTHAYINVSYNDSLSQTTGLNIYLNQSNPNDIQNQSVIDSYSGAAQSITVPFIVEGYTGQAYFVTVIADHTELDTIQRSYSVTFAGMAEDRGFSSLWIWLGIGAVMFTGLIFKSETASSGSVVVCGVGWIVYILGFYDNLGENFTLAIGAGLALATILSIAGVMAKGRKEG